MSDTPFAYAAKNGDIETVKQLTPTVNIHDAKEYAIRWACRYGNYEIVKHLVEHGADFRANYDEPVRWSSEMGHLKVVKYLVDLGADFRAFDNDAIRFACANGHLEVVKYLADLGADFRDRNDEAIRKASEHGRLEVVKYLVEKGVDFRCNNDIVIRNACINGFFNIVRYGISIGVPESVLDTRALTHIRECKIHWSRMNHLENFSYITSDLFMTLLLGIQKLEESGFLLLADQSMLEEMLEAWTVEDDYDLFSASINTPKSI